MNLGRRKQVPFEVASPPQEEGTLSQLPSQLSQVQQLWELRERQKNHGSEESIYLVRQEDRTHSQSHRADHQPDVATQELPYSESGFGGQGIAERRTSSTGLLRPVTEIPQQYRQLFSQFPYFNIVQSTVFQDVIYSDRSVVVSAPTGSGKTVVMELAIVRLLQSRPCSSNDHQPPVRVVYMAPLKAVVKERYLDWQQRLSKLKLTCAEVTGDTEHDDISVIRNSQVVLTTPEKWDSLTRRWRDHASLMQAVSLLLIDEVHVLSDEGRGPTLEAVVSRMKTIRATRPTTSDDHQHDTPRLRFVAVSATIPNVEDVAVWLSDEDGPAVFHRLEENLRPVSLRRVVLGYDCRESWTEFRFDIALTYRLPSVIATYSDNKPTLVFVSTRKAAQTTAMTLMREARLVRDASHRQLLTSVGNSLRDNKLRECVLCGVGYHHAGLEASDRHQVEELFLAGQLPVLVSTSTLAMGVNLPAHLVVVKSTAQYAGGAYKEYSTTQLLQMMGRAGRPQFDDHATAVIMTKNQHKEKYENLVSGRSLLESHLHLHLVEHLNAEIVLGTVTDLGVAVEWLRSTFFYVRVQHNPRHYGLPQRLQQTQLEAKLQEMCMREVNALAQVGLILLSEVDVKATPAGRLMARYCVSFSTMKTFIQLRGDESIRELVELVAASREFWDIKVRSSEKRVLNDLNKSPSSCIRFPIKGRIKTREQKINCLVQGTLGCQAIVDPGLSQDANKIMRIGQRITKCMAEYGATRPEYELQLNTTLLAKCFCCRLWENSRHVTRQLERIGPALSTSFVHSKITSFSALEVVSPRDIELIVNRQPPFGNRVRDQIVKLPRYELTLEQINQVRVECSDVRVTVRLVNYLELKGGATTPRHHSCRLIVGDASNNIAYHQRVTDVALLIGGSVTRLMNVARAQNGDELAVNFISETWAGLDVQSCYTPRYLPRPCPPPQHSTAISKSPRTGQGGGGESSRDGVALRPEGDDGEAEGRRACFHACADKTNCAHNCCKVGVSAGHQRGSSRRGMSAVVQEIRKRASQLPTTHKMRITGSDITKRFSKFKYSPAGPRLLPKPKSEAVSLASCDANQPDADNNSNHPNANQNIPKPAGSQDIRQLIANQNLRQRVTNQNASQRIADQNAYQPATGQSTSEPTVNKNTCQSNAKQSELWPSASQVHTSSNIRQFANQTVDKSKLIPLPTHFSIHQQTDEVIDEEVLQEFENVSSFDEDEWEGDLPDLVNYIAEEGQENYPSGSATEEEEKYDALTEPLDIDDLDSSSVDLSAASWHQFHTRQQQYGISRCQQSTTNSPIMFSLSGAPTAALNIGRKPPVSQSQLGQQGTKLHGFEQEPRNTSMMQIVAKEQRLPWTTDEQNLHRQRPSRPGGMSTNHSTLHFSGVQVNQNQMPRMQVNQGQKYMYSFRAHTGQNKRPIQSSAPQANKVQRELGSDGMQMNQTQRPARPQGTQESQAQRPPRPQGTQARQAQMPLRPQGAQVSQAQRPLRPQETQVSQAQRPLRPQETQVSQAQMSLRPQGTQMSQNQSPLRPQGTQMSQVQRPLRPQGTQVTQTQRPLRPQGTQVSQAQMPLKPQGARVSQAQMPLRPQGTQVNQAQMPLRPQGTQVTQAQRPLRPQGTQVSQAQIPQRSQGSRVIQAQMPLRPQGTQVSQAQMPLRPQGTQVSQAQMPLRPQGTQVSQAQMPLRPQGTLMSQAQRPLRPQGTQVSHAQMPLRPQGTLMSQAQRPLRPQETQMSQFQGPIRPQGIHINRIQIPSGSLEPTTSQVQDPLLPSVGQADQIPTGQAGQSESPLSPLEQTYQEGVTHFNEGDRLQNSVLPLHSYISYRLPDSFNGESQQPLSVTDNRYQMPPDVSSNESRWTEELESEVDQSEYWESAPLADQLGYQTPILTSQVGHSRYHIPAVSSQINQSGDQIPTSVEQVGQSQYQVPTFLANQATRPEYETQQSSPLSATSAAPANLATFEHEDGPVSSDWVCGTYYTPHTARGSWPAQSVPVSNVLRQEPIPSEVGFAASRYQSLVGNQEAPTQRERLIYWHRNTGCTSLSVESADRDCSAEQSHDHTDQASAMLQQSSSQQVFPGNSRVLQYSKPVAGIKPLALTFGQSLGSEQNRVKDDPFSHLTKEWAEAQRGRTRGRLCKIMPTPQAAPRSAAEATASSTDARRLDDWRDLEMFQRCRQQERLALDSLYRKGQASAVADKAGKPRQLEGASLCASGTQGDAAASPGSLHITYTSGDRGPALGVGLTNVGCMQQNININLSSILDEARSTQRAPVTDASRAPNTQMLDEPQVRGILKKPIQSAWSGPPDIFEGII